MAGKSEALQYSKGHLFKAKTMLKPVKCYHCGKFVWGWEKGYKCKECSMIVHKKCIRLVNDSCTAEGAVQISGPEEGTLKHMEGVRHDKIGQMVHIDNSEKYKEDPVLQRLFKSAGIDQNHLGPGALDFAVKFAQEQKLYEFYQAVVPPERRERHRKRLETGAAPPPPPPLPPPPKVSTPKLVVKPRTTTDENQGEENVVMREEVGEQLTLVEELKRGTVTLRKTSRQPDFERKTVQDTDLHGTLASALAGFRANIELNSDEDDDYSDEEWADLDRKKKGKSKGGGKLGAIVETMEVEKGKEEKREVEKRKEENGEKFSSPLYKEYMTKLMKNRASLDEAKSRRSSENKETLEKKAEIESKIENSSKNGSEGKIQTNLSQSPKVKKNEPDKPKEEAGSKTEASKKNKNDSVATGNVEKTSELKTNEKSSRVELPNSEEKTEESAKVGEKIEEKSISTNDKKVEKEENPKANKDKSRSDVTNNVKKVVESGGEGSQSGSPVNFRASLRPPKGQKVI